MPFIDLDLTKTPSGSFSHDQLVDDECVQVKLSSLIPTGGTHISQIWVKLHIIIDFGCASLLMQYYPDL